MYVLYWLKANLSSFTCTVYFKSNKIQTQYLQMLRPSPHMIDQDHGGRGRGTERNRCVCQGPAWVLIYVLLFKANTPIFSLPKTPSSELQKLTGPSICIRNQNSIWPTWWLRFFPGLKSLNKLYHALPPGPSITQASMSWWPHNPGLFARRCLHITSCPMESKV